MKFCGRCGYVLVQKVVGDDTRERAVCTNCHYVHYENPKVLVWLFAYWENRLLLCRRAIAPAKGLWNAPAGFVEAGETLEEAVCRETFEEVGLNLAPSSLILYRVASIPHMNEIYVGFRVQLHVEPHFKLGPEVSEARLWSEAELPVNEFAFREMLEGIPEDFFQCLRTGQFPVFSHIVRPEASTRA
jgi:NADH pyrophosphatase NudC (nudix superfamily)